MEALYRQEGAAVDYTPSGTSVAAGEIIQVGGFAGVANKAIADGEFGALQIDGVFDVTKAAGAGVTFATGDVVGWDDVNNTAVTDADVNKTFDLGLAVADAGDGDATVRTRINW